MNVIEALPKIYVVDASVVVKWLNQEKEQNLAQALNLLDAMEQGQAVVISSDLLVHEVINALWKGKGLSKKDLELAIDVFFRLPLDIIATSQSLAQRAVLVARKYDLTFYDAVYAALAQETESQLITANPKCHGRITDGSVIALKHSATP